MIGNILWSVLAGLALVPFGKAVVRAGAPLPPDSQVYLSL